MQPLWVAAAVPSSLARSLDHPLQACAQVTTPRELVTMRLLTSYFNRYPDLLSLKVSIDFTFVSVNIYL